MEYGIGSIDVWKRADGTERHRARVPNGRGGHKTIGSFDTREEAEDALTVAGQRRAAGTLALDGETLRTWGKTFLERRELNGGRNAKTDRSRWARHILTAPFANWPLESIAPKHVAAWIDRLSAKHASDKRARRRLSAQTIRHAVALLRRALQMALTRGLVKVNAAAGHDLPKVRKDDGWTYLLPEEVHRLISAPEIPRADRLAIQFAIGSGLRQGEQWTLELRDVHADEEHPYVLVRWGGVDAKTGRPTPPKNGKQRRVPLFGLALDAARAWLAILPTWAERNPAGLMWPTQRGHRRRDGKPPRGWARTKGMPADRTSYLEAAGLADASTRHDRRSVRWHDLRHTCATRLLCGWNETRRRWTLVEIAALLGHTSTEVTERYAHLAPGELDDAARATNGSGPPAPTTAPPPPGSLNLPGSCQGSDATDAESPDSPSAPQRIRTSGLRLRRPLAVLGVDREIQGGADPSGRLAGRLRDARALAATGLAAIRADDPFAGRKAVEGLAAAIEAIGAVLAVVEGARESGGAPRRGRTA